MTRPARTRSVPDRSPRHRDTVRGPAAARHRPRHHRDRQLRPTDPRPDRPPVLAPDLLGFGAASKPLDVDYGPQLWAEQSWALLDERGIDRVGVVGNSMGARVALAMAVKNPQRIRGLVLLSTRVVASATTPAQKLLRNYTPSLAGMEQLIRACFAGDQDLVTPEVIRSRYEASAQPGAHEAMQRVFAGLAATPALDTAELAAIAAPVLLLHGRDDRVVPADNGVRLAELLPHADLHLLAGTGHWLQTERAARSTS